MDYHFDKDKFKRYWQRVFHLMVQKHPFFNASAITFNLFICAIPFTLILVSLLGYILSFDAAFEEVVRYGRELFPSFTYETREGDVIEGAVTLERLIMPLVTGHQILGIVGFVTLIFFAQGLFRTFKHVLFTIFDFAERKHPVIEFIYNFITFGIVGGVFIIFSMSIFIVSLVTFDPITVPYTDVVIKLGWMYELLITVIPMVFTFFLIYIIYRYISEKRLSGKLALIGALTYTILFELARIGVSYYMEHAFTAYRYFYHGYTILILIGLWMFYSAMLFVIAAIIARAYEDVYVKNLVDSRENPYTSIS